MNFIEQKIKGLYEIILNPLKDDRGSFARLFCKTNFSNIGLDEDISQINHSVNVEKGTLRGLHFQNPPFSEVKIIKCLKGAVQDVVIDIRKDSPTFLQYLSIELSVEKNNAIFIPKGFAHGFQTLEDNSELLYLHTVPYNKQSEGGLRYNDITLNISWPFTPRNITQRDESHPLIDNTFLGI